MLLHPRRHSQTTSRATNAKHHTPICPCSSMCPAPRCVNRSLATTPSQTAPWRTITIEMKSKNVQWSVPALRCCSACRRDSLKEPLQMVEIAAPPAPTTLASIFEESLPRPPPPIAPSPDTVNVTLRKFTVPSPVDPPTDTQWHREEAARERVRAVVVSRITATALYAVRLNQLPVQVMARPATPVVAQVEDPVPGEKPWEPALFAPRPTLYDTDSMYAKAFALDWSRCVKKERFVRVVTKGSASGELERVKQAVAEHYALLYHIFVQYASMGLSQDAFAIQVACAGGGPSGD